MPMTANATPSTAHLDGSYDALVADRDDSFEDGCYDAEMAFERFLENGGEANRHGRMDAEDEIERAAEANDMGLGELRAGR